MAGVLAGGSGALLGLRAAGALWGVRHHSGATNVITFNARAPQHGITFHRARIPQDERTVLDGIPVTGLSRTLFDLAGAIPRHQLLRALNEAEVQRLTDHLSLPELLERYPRKAGAPALREALDRLPSGGVVLRSDMEALFLTFVGDRGIPRPALNQNVHGFEVDAVWWLQRVVVELDSRDFHDQAIAYETDRERDRILSAADWRPIRITWRQLTQTPEAVERDLRRMLRQS